MNIHYDLAKTEIATRVRAAERTTGRARGAHDQPHPRCGDARHDQPAPRTTLTTALTEPRNTSTERPVAGAAPADPSAESSACPKERRRRIVGLGLLVSSQFVVMLDTSIVN